MQRCVVPGRRGRCLGRRLEAFTQLLKALPADTGMAFVLVQHLAPSHPSALAESLSRATKMPVLEVRDQLRVEPNHLYVIPPRPALISCPFLTFNRHIRDK